MKVPLSISLKTFARIMQSLSEKVMFVSHLAMKSVLPDGAQNAVVIPNGVDVSRFRFREPLGNKGEPLICFLGGLSHRKGADILLLAIAFLRNELKTAVCLDIWGSDDTENRASLNNLVEKTGIANAVRFMGYGRKVEEILQEYRVLVVPSRGESFSLAVLEGMASGVPVVATRCGGPEEIIDDAINGHLVEVGDYEQMAHAVKRILDEPEYGKLLATNARKKVVDSFDLRNQFHKILQLLMPSIVLSCRTQNGWNRDVCE